MPREVPDSTGCSDLISILLEGRSHLLYRGADRESNAVARVAKWLEAREGPLDVTIVERIQQSLTWELIGDLAEANRRLVGYGLHREAGAVRPFVILFRDMLELRQACSRMQRRYRELQELMAGAG